MPVCCNEGLVSHTNILYGPHHSLPCFCNSGYQAQNPEVEQTKDLQIQAWFYPSLKGIFSTYCLHSKGGWTLLVGNHEELIARGFEDCSSEKKIFLINLILTRSTNWVLSSASVFADETCYCFTFWFFRDPRIYLLILHSMKIWWCFQELYLY